MKIKLGILILISGSISLISFLLAWYSSSVTRDYWISIVMAVIFGLICFISIVKIINETSR